MQFIAERSSAANSEFGMRNSELRGDERLNCNLTSAFSKNLFLSTMFTEMIGVEFPPRPLIPNSEFRIPNSEFRISATGRQTQIYPSMSFTQLLKMLPYVVTVIVLTISSVRNRREDQPPAGLGINYYREER